MVDMNKITTYMDLVNTASEHVTFNTLENIYNKLDRINSENLITIRNFNAVLLQAESMTNEQIKNMIIPRVANQLEQYVSQV